jgi:hypothetical protein
VYYVALDFTNPLTAGYTDNTLIGYAPSNRGESSTALVVDVSGTTVTIRRVDMHYGVEIAAPFVFDTSVCKEQYPYTTEKQIAKSSAPEFSADAEISISNLSKTGCTYTFPQAENTSAGIPDDGAFVYTVAISESGTGEIVSTARLQANYFTLPLPETVTYNATGLKPDAKYNISVVPIGFYGKEGQEITANFKTLDLLGLSLTTSANLVKKGDYFVLKPSFENTVNSNASVLTFTFDPAKFEYRGFTPADGVTLLTTDVAGDTLKMTFMVADYNTKDYGEVLFSAKEDANLKNEDNTIHVFAQVAVKAEDGSKSILTSEACTGFTTTESGVPGDVDGKGYADLIDLSNVIDLFGVKIGDAQWSSAKFFDFNGNGVIDIQDIVTVAMALTSQK